MWRKRLDSNQTIIASFLHRAHITSLYVGITVTYTAVGDLQQDLALFRIFQRHILHCPVGARLFDNACFVCFWERHVVWWTESAREVKHSKILRATVDLSLLMTASALRDLADPTRGTLIAQPARLLQVFQVLLSSHLGPADHDAMVSWFS